MDLATFAAAYESLKAGKQILSTVLDAKVDAEAKPKIIAALEQLGNTQEKLFNVREELFRLQAENDTLRRELSASQAWENRSSTYQLAKTAGGAVVYRYNAQPEHFACPSCFNAKQIQILQDNRTYSGKFRCSGCTAEYPINPRQTPPSISSNVRPRGRLKFEVQHLHSRKVLHGNLLLASVRSRSSVDRVDVQARP